MQEVTQFHPRAVIFDMDGLMLDTERPMIPLWAIAGETLGYTMTEGLVIRTLGLNEAAIRALVLGEFGEDFPYDVFRDKLGRLADEYFEDNLEHKKGLLPLLDHLAAGKIPLAVATSTGREKAAAKLRKAGILDRFTALVFGDEITRGKPDPEIFLRAAEKLAVPPSLCAGFEDSPAGLRGLHAAGIHSVYIKDIIDPPPDVLASVWKRPADLAAAIPLFL